MEMASKGLFSNFWTGSKRESYTTETQQFTMFERPPGRSKKDIGSCKSAIMQAESYYNPNRADLYDIYAEQLDFDAHLKGITEKRTLNILNKEIVYVDQDGEIIEDVTGFFSIPDFEDFLRDAFETRYWGYSLFEFDYKDGFNYTLIPRKHVRPESKIVVRNQTDATGIQYNTPDVEKFVLSFGKTKDLGILKTAVYYSVYKRNTYGDWGNYVELAGNNFELIKYSGNDIMLKNATENALKKTGANGQVAIPDGVDVDFINKSSTSQNQLFEGFTQKLNDEQSKLILGQTMTTDDGSSRSQAEVHQTQQNDIFFADEQYILAFLNFKFKKKLPNWGLNQEGTFTFKKRENILAMLEQDKALKDLGYVFTPEYLKEKYNIND